MDLTKLILMLVCDLLIGLVFLAYVLFCTALETLKKRELYLTPQKTRIVFCFGQRKYMIIKG